jgi:hypothetical protein
MKQNAILTARLLAAVPVWAQTVVSTSFTNNTPASIADGNPVGTTEQIPVSGVGGSVTNVQVQLDISGGRQLPRLQIRWHRHAGGRLLKPGAGDFVCVRKP